MRSKIGIFSVVMAVMASALGGCANHEAGGYIGSEPTLKAVQAAPDQKLVYRETLYTLSDFQPDGKLKSFTDYDFTVETAPCTVLGGSYSVKTLQREESYSVRGSDGIAHTFICRNVGAPGEFRLMLGGSTVDCESRRWRPEHSMLSVERKRTSQCLQMGARTAHNDEVEARYLKSFPRS